MEGRPRATWARESPTRQISIVAWWCGICDDEMGADEDEEGYGDEGGGIRAVESARAVG